MVYNTGLERSWRRIDDVIIEFGYTFVDMAYYRINPG